jgi:hypothetical protein
MYMYISMYIYMYIQLGCKYHLGPETEDDDVYLEYYSGKGFHINYSSLHVLRKTHQLVQEGISNEH